MTILVTQTLGSSSSEKMVSEDRDPARYQCRSSQLDSSHHDISDFFRCFRPALFKYGAGPFANEPIPPAIFASDNLMPQLTCPQCDHKMEPLRIDLNPD